MSIDRHYTKDLQLNMTKLMMIVLAILTNQWLDTTEEKELYQKANQERGVNQVKIQMSNLVGIQTI